MATPCTNTTDYFCSGSGLTPDWTSDSDLSFTGSGSEVDYSESDISYYFQNGSGTHVDFCEGGRILTSFTGKLTVSMTTSVNYKVDVTSKHYTVEVITQTLKN